MRIAVTGASGRLGGQVVESRRLVAAARTGGRLALPAEDGHLAGLSS